MDIQIKTKNYGTLTVLIDNEDYPLIAGLQSNIHRVRHVRRPDCFYVRYRINGKKELLHRIVMRANPGQTIDHINSNGLDCRKENLRFCTHQQNMANRLPMPGGSSKFLGVWRERERWRAGVTHNRKSYKSISFENEVDAARAYDRMAREFHGEFARLNFPDG